MAEIQWLVGLQGNFIRLFALLANNGALLHLYLMQTVVNKKFRLKELHQEMLFLIYLLVFRVMTTTYASTIHTLTQNSEYKSYTAVQFSPVKHFSLVLSSVFIYIAHASRFFVYHSTAA